MKQHLIPTATVGEHLREDFLPDYGIKAPTLAKSLGVPRSRVVRLLEGARCDGDMALRLGRLFGTSPQSWLNLQALHDLSTAQALAGAEIEASITPLEAA
ncbi:HigA family addiction module antitoxin [Maricaulis maris]|jgi:addiction module HigA family antidote|uniref:HigA family addiction module antitoxin n=1 Tax=Maricaulis maris TaxID=74318 RepID=UPI0026F24218|nr:HigA family addiction module antitoxin [Maricaulis maris]